MGQARGLWSGMQPMVAVGASQPNAVGAWPIMLMRGAWPNMQIAAVSAYYTYYWRSVIVSVNTYVILL